MMQLEKHLIKLAKLIGLGYPGGSEIEKEAKHGNEDAV